MSTYISSATAISTIGASTVFNKNPVNTAFGVINNEYSKLTGDTRTAVSSTTATLTANVDTFVYVTNNTGNVTITLPSASTQYKDITIKKAVNNNFTVTIARAGSDTIEDPTKPLTTPTATSITIINNCDDSITLTPVGTTWKIKHLYYSPTISWIAPTLLNSWVNYGVGFTTVGYRLNRNTNKVEIKGFVKSGTTGQPIFNLPTGYRPSVDYYFPVLSNFNPSGLLISEDGSVQNTGTASNVWFSLDNISFYI